VDGELHSSEVFVGYVNRDLVCAEYNFKNVINHLGTKLVFKRLATRQVKVADSEVLFVFDLAFLWEALDVTEEVSYESTIFNMSPIIVRHFVVDIH